VVWIPKYRGKKLLIDHVHMLSAIPPKNTVVQVIGYLKGKSAIHIARTFDGRQKNFIGEHIWARGYSISTVGINEAVIRRFIEQ
jgi:putative transposase